MCRAKFSKCAESDFESSRSLTTAAPQVTVGKVQLSQIETYTFDFKSTRHSALVSPAVVLHKITLQPNCFEVARSAEVLESSACEPALWLALQTQRKQPSAYRSRVWLWQVLKYSPWTLKGPRQSPISKPHRPQSPPFAERKLRTSERSQEPALLKYLDIVINLYVIRHQLHFLFYAG